MMKPRIWLVLSLIVISWLTAQAAERQLAGIRIGMRPKEVFEILGDPTALLMAQPPLSATASLNNIMPDQSGGTSAASDQPATLVFLYKDQEVELNDNTGLSLSSVEGNALPLWAYLVRVARLSLDQQELIYRLNDVYSLGITITGQGNEARVTDIIACNLAPLTVWPPDPVRPSTTPRVFDRKDPYFADMFKYTYSQKKPMITAGTSKRVTMGSRLDEVLKNHRWPTFFLPFTTDALATEVFKKTAPELTGSMETIGPTGINTSFASGATGAFSINFTTNCVLLYPDDNLALTLINYMVIRIQIGREMAKPNLGSFVPSSGGA